MVMLFRLNPDAVQILSSRTCAFIFRSRQYREGIIGKGGKMSGVGGISRARLHRVSLLRLCPSLFVSHTRVSRTHSSVQLFYLESPASDAPRDTQDGWFRMRICVQPAVDACGFPRFLFPGKRSLTFVAVFHTENRNQCAHARKRARRKLIDIANAHRQTQEIDLTRLNSRRREEVTCVLIVNRLLF